MAYTNKTPNYGLPQYLGTDKASWLDFNEPFNTVDLAIKENAANADSAIAVSSAAVNTANTASDTANSSLTKSNEALVHATSAENNANTALEKAQEAIDTIGTAKELKEQVEANTANIATNTTDIASIEEDLASVKTDVAANTAGVAELKAYNDDSNTWYKVELNSGEISLNAATLATVDYDNSSFWYRKRGDIIDVKIYLKVDNLTIPANSNYTLQSYFHWRSDIVGQKIKEVIGINPNDGWTTKSKFPFSMINNQTVCRSDYTQTLSDISFDYWNGGEGVNGGSFIISRWQGSLLNGVSMSYSIDYTFMPRSYWHSL